MQRRQFLRQTTALTLAALCADRAAMRALAADKPKRKILFFTKSSGFDHPVISYSKGQPSHSEKVLTELAPTNGFEFVFSKDGSLFTPEYLKQFSALFFYTTGDLTKEGTDKNPGMTPAGKQALIDYVAAGGGFIGSHSASDTFHSGPDGYNKGADRYRNWGGEADAYIKMLGGEFIKHGAQQKSHMRCVDAKFPGLGKYADGFTLQEEWYSLKEFSEDLHVLLVQETEGMKGEEYARGAYPATWARKHGKGRVFYTSMGHREDVWTNPIFQDVLLGGLHWACGDVEADVTPNLKEVAPKYSELPPFPPKTPAK